MTRTLDTIYKAAGFVSATLIVAICVLASCQIMLNGLSRPLPGPLLLPIPPYADFAGFLLPGSSFLAKGHTPR